MNKRIIEGWTTEEIEELKNFKEHYSSNVFSIIGEILGEREPCIHLSERYYNSNSDEHDIYFIKDITDYFAGEAEFPEEKWYVHFVEEDDNSYLNFNTINDSRTVGSKMGSSLFDRKTQFTESEVEYINPKYLEFLEKVPTEELGGPGND